MRFAKKQRNKIKIGLQEKLYRSKKITNQRSKLFFVFFFLLYIGLLTRVVWLNYAPFEHRGAQLREEASLVWSRINPIQPERGNIYDRNGKLLATNTRADSIVVNNKILDRLQVFPDYENDPDITEVSSKEELAFILDDILGLGVEEIMEILNDKSLDFVYLARVVSKEQVEQIKALKLQGFYYIYEPKRIYPLNDFGSSFLGFAGFELEGKSGLELQYNETLKGTPGSNQTIEAISGQNLPYLDPGEIKAIDGASLYLTIDEQLQIVLEKELNRAIEINLADGGAALIMDPYTSEILALAAYPSYNLNDTLKYGAALHRNPIISDSFEPGSTFKIVTCMAALELGYTYESELFNDPGYYQIGPDRIWNWDKGADHGLVSLMDAMRNSSNVIMGQLGLRLGAEQLVDFQKRLGFGDKTGIDYPGESEGLLFNPELIREIELFTSAFGQGPSVTPLQQLNAINAIINGGILNQPHFLKSSVNSEGTVEEFEMSNSSRVISEDTSLRMRKILEYVLNAPGSRGASEMFRLAGKTGTANKFNPNTGGYYDDIYISSTIGYAPADNPIYSIFIYLDNPHGPDGYYGGQTAAPAFRRIAEEILKVSGYLPDELEKVDLTDSNLKILPEYRGLTKDEILEIFEEDEISLIGSGEIILGQFPEPGSSMTKGESITFLLGEIDEEDPLTVIVPDFVGLSLPEAVSLSRQLGLNLNISGQGICLEQGTEPQTRVSKGSSINAVFK